MTNRVNLAQLREMTAEQAARLPVDQIAMLLEDLAEAKAALKQSDDLLHAALNYRYAERAALVREAQGKNTGTVSLDDGEFTIRADLPKSVEWDEKGLIVVEERLVSMGEPPDDYIQHRRVVSEAAYQRWPSSLQSMFAPYRTVGVGKPTYKIERRTA